MIMSTIMVHIAVTSAMRKACLWYCSCDDDGDDDDDDDGDRYCCH